MNGALARAWEEDGVLVMSADVNGYTLSELRFPRGFVQEPFEPEAPYLAVVLDGALTKSFSRQTLSLTRTSALAMPSGATHAARFGPDGARIVVVKPPRVANGAAGCLTRLVELREASFGWLAWRLAGELRASDTAAPLAAEGLACELLATATRENGTRKLSPKPPAWLSAAEEFLRASVGEHIGLRELAEVVGVHPTHVARVFRAHYGVSVGEYARRARLAWAASELARSDASLAEIAADAGFADQSHFTRLFRKHLGITPAQYRAGTQAAGQSEH